MLDFNNENKIKILCNKKGVGALLRKSFDIYMHRVLCYKYHDLDFFVS